MCALTQEDVLRIVKIVEESNTDELHLETGDLKLIIRRGGARAGVEISSKTPKTETINFETVQKPAQAALLKPTRSTVSAIHEADKAQGIVPIRASTLGTFYKAPNPGAPPFVEVGQVVSEEDTVCIIEVMKLFTTVKAGVRGRIAKICVEDGDMVEFNQNLFLLEKVDDEAAAGKA